MIGKFRRYNTQVTRETARSQGLMVPFHREQYEHLIDLTQEGNSNIDWIPRSCLGRLAKKCSWPGGGSLAKKCSCLGTLAK